MRINASDAGVILSIGQSLNFSAVGQDVEILHRVLKIKQPVIFDADGLQQISSGSLQMLLVFVQALKKEQIPYHWENLSQEFRHAITLMGMEYILDEERENHGD